MNEDEQKKLSQKAGWEAIGNLLAPNNGKLYTKPFTPQIQIDYYLDNEFSVQIYDDLTENETWKGLFDPLDFFNLFSEQERIIIDNKTKPTILKTHLINLELNKKQLYFLLLTLYERVMYYYHSGLKANVEDKAFFICSKFIGKEIEKLRGEFTPEKSSSKYALEEVKESSKPLIEEQKAASKMLPKTITRKELILKTLELIEHEGRVDVKSFWNFLGISDATQKSARRVFLDNELISINPDLPPYYFAITEHKGAPLLSDHSKFNEIIFKDLPQNIGITSEMTEYILPAKDIFNACFIVHGHDVRYQEVARFIEREFKLTAKILHEETNEGQTLIEKFEKNSVVDFAVCLWTADDEGKSKNNGSLKYRPRQNVIFETGFFIGKLGRRYVIVLLDKEIELPSDYDGVNYIAFEGNWKYELSAEIKKILK